LSLCTSRHRLRPPRFPYTKLFRSALTAYRPEEKDRAQAAINFCVYATLALSAFSSGVLVTTQGWTLLNAGSLVPIAATGLALCRSEEHTSELQSREKLVCRLLLEI